MRKFSFEVRPQFQEDYDYWKEINKKTLKRINELLRAIESDPFKGIGKPEHLKHVYPTVWSRRITKEHRIVYMVEGRIVILLQCRYHYGK